MTEQPIQLPPVDNGNPFLRPDYPTSVDTGYTMFQAVQYLAFTLRVANNTATGFFNREQLEAIIRKLTIDLQGMRTVSGLIIPNGVITQGPVQ